MAMYFVRHGIALAKEADPDHPLSAEETAQIFANQIGDGSVYQRSGMDPKDNVKVFSALLEADDTMYVGHLPYMGKLVSYLTTGDEDADVIKFANGGVVCIEKDGEKFHIEWYLKPSIC